MAKLLSNSMQQSSVREVNTLSVDEPFREPIVHYGLHKSPPLASNLSQMNPTHIFTPILLPPFDLRLDVPSGLCATQ
jgi:hypothetical protein